MTIPEASQLVIQAGAMGKGGEIFVLDMGDPVKIFDLARDMIRLSGLRSGEDIEIQFTGVRAGEKLYEELHSDSDKHVPTSHPKIVVAESLGYDVQHIRAAIAALEKMTNASTDEILLELKRIVPEFNYHPQPSVAARQIAA